MKFESRIPGSLLRPFVKSFMIIESDEGMVNRILPDTSIIMAFKYKGTTSSGMEDKLSLPTSAISGLTKSSRFVDYSKETGTLLVAFTEGGARSFSAMPLHELFGLHVSLDNFIQRRKVDTVVSQLAEAKQSSQKFALIEQFMLSQLREPQSDQLIHHAVQKIKRANGDLRIKDLATSLSISQDAFEKRFNRTIGASPKQFAKIVRLRNVINTYSRTKSLTDAALRAGYFDQAHFIKDFTAFTGKTPTDFFSVSRFAKSLIFYNDGFWQRDILRLFNISRR